MWTYRVWHVTRVFFDNPDRLRFRYRVSYSKHGVNCSDLTVAWERVVRICFAHFQPMPQPVIAARREAHDELQGERLANHERARTTVRQVWKLGVGASLTVLSPTEYAAAPATGMALSFLAPAYEKQMHAPFVIALVLSRRP